MLGLPWGPPHGEDPAPAREEPLGLLPGEPAADTLAAAAPALEDSREAAAAVAAEEQRAAGERKFAAAAAAAAAEAAAAAAAAASVALELPAKGDAAGLASTRPTVAAAEAKVDGHLEQ